jgi:branched-chain amino acid transport system permease protein
MRPRSVLEATLRGAPALVLVGALFVVAVLGSFGSASFAIEVATLLTFAVVVIGMYSFIGLSGVVSFGHVAFMAIGAYTAALITTPVTMKHVLLPDLPQFLATASIGQPLSAVVAGAAAAVVALVIAPVTMRLSGIAAALAMLAVLVIVNVVIRQAESITGGLRAMTGVPVDTTVWSAFVWAAIAVALVHWYQESASGLRLRASREDDVGAEALGVNLTRERSIALVLSAFLVGVGGSLYVHLLGAVSPSSFYIALTFSTLAMLIVGGMTSLSGAVVGTIVTFSFTELLRQGEKGVDLGFVALPSRPGLQLVGVGVATLLILALRPSGLTGGRELDLRWFKGRLGVRASRTRAGRVPNEESRALAPEGGGSASSARPPS